MIVRYIGERILIRVQVNVEVEVGVSIRVKSGLGSALLCMHSGQ